MRVRGEKIRVRGEKVWVGGEVRDQKCPGTFLNGALGSKIHKKQHFVRILIL